MFRRVIKDKYSFNKSEGSNFPFPHWLASSPLQHSRTTCDCEIYNSRTLRISGSNVSGCRYEEWGNIYWTAGQRIDPSRNTTFIWRKKSTDTNSETVSHMSYTNWHSTGPQPDFYLQAESCMHLVSRLSYTWNDVPCGNTYCPICELDI